MSRNRRLLLVLACCAVAGLVLLAYFLTLPSKPNSPTLTCTQGAPTPSGIVYDPSNGLVYVAETLTNHLVAMNATTHAVVARIAVGCWPGAVAFDPSNQEVFVANYGSGNVSVIDPSTNTVIANVATDTGPVALAFDPLTNLVYVAEPGEGVISAINATSNTLATFPWLDWQNAPNGGDANGLAFDPLTDNLYVADARFCGSCSGFPNGYLQFGLPASTSPGTVPVGVGPRAVLPDPQTGDVYVANTYSNNVSVVNDSTHTVTSSISVGHSPDALLLTPSGNNLYVADFGSDTGCLFEGCTSSTSPASGNVTVVNATQGTVEGTIEVGSEPVSMAYDAALSSLYVTNWRAGTISVISTVTNTVIATISLSV